MCVLYVWYALYVSCGHRVLHDLDRESTAATANISLQRQRSLLLGTGCAALLEEVARGALACRFDWRLLVLVLAAGSSWAPLEEIPEQAASSAALTTALFFWRSQGSVMTGSPARSGMPAA